MNENYWRKRDEHDTILDLRMPFNLLDRLVRSYTIPYPCAKLLYDFYELPVCRIRKIKGLDKKTQRIETGKVLNVSDGRIQVKVDDCIAELELMVDVPVGLEKGIYIHPPTSYIKFQSSEMTDEDKTDWLRSIENNKNGY